MKKKNFFMLALAALAFAACSNEDLVLNGEDNGANEVTDPTGDAWLALKVKQASTGRSRALNNPDDQLDGTAAESKVEDVQAIFFNGPNANSVVTKVIALSSAEMGTPGQPSGTHGDAFQVPATSKTVLIVVNSASLGLVPTAGTTTFADVNAAVLAADLSTTVAKPNYFLMTNAKGDLEPSDAYGNTTELTLYDTDTEAEAHPMPIYVDRVVAKVRVFAAENASATANIYDPGWVLNVTNKKFFPVSKRVKTWNETPAGDRGICISPFDIYKIGSYRVDPNFDDNTIGELGTSGYGENYNYFSSTTDLSTINWKDMGTTNDPVSEYCLENTQEEKYNVHSYTTQVLVKANFAPKGLKTVAGGTVDVAKNQDWMIINGSYYTYETLLDYIEEELKNKYIDITGNYPTSRTDALNQYLTDILSTQVDIPATLEEPDAEAQASLLRGKFEDLKDDVEAAGGQETASVRYYSAGVSYYKIMIKHDDTTAELNKFGEFGVVRNSIYDVRINKFNNPGSPIIPDPTTDKKDEDEDKFLSIEININPWTWYTQISDL